MGVWVLVVRDCCGTLYSANSRQNVFDLTLCACYSLGDIQGWCGMAQVKLLIKEDKYAGKYVALKDFDDQTVIADGDIPQIVYDQAVAKGYDCPVVMFVPVKDMVHIY